MTPPITVIPVQGDPEDGALPPSEDRATHEQRPLAVSAVPVGIPSADDVRLLNAGPDGDGGFGFTFADGEEGGVIRILAEHLLKMMGIGTEHELNCVEMQVKPRGVGPWFILTMQRSNGKAPLALKVEAVKLLQQTLEAIETGRSEPLFAMRDAIRNWLADDLTAQAMSAGTAETPQGAQGEARQRGPAKLDAPTPSSPSTPSHKEKEQP